MRPAPRYLALLAAAYAVCLFGRLAHAGHPDQERLLLESANGCFAARDYGAAADLFDKFLNAFPKSAAAPEAAYKLAALHLLLEKPAEAKKTFATLTRDYFTSTWAQLYLLTYCEEEQLFTLACDRRQEAFQPDQRQRADEAIRLFEIYQARFAAKADTDKKDEVLYKLADCYRLAGNQEWFQHGMRLLAAGGADKGWGKLADYRLSYAEKFQQGMDDLMELSGVGSENEIAFLDLAAAYEQILVGDERVKCLYYQARCLQGQGEIDRALTAYGNIVEEHPLSSWAAESAFWLAEQHFDAGEFDVAKVAYREFLDTYPESPRQAKVRRWLAWLDDLDPATEELELVLEQLFMSLSKATGNIAFNLRSAGEGKPFELRVALRGPEEFLLSMHHGKSVLIVANNEEGAWFGCYLDQPEVVRSKEKLRFPIPHGAWTLDDQALAFNWGISSSAAADGEPLMKIPLELAEFLAKRARSSMHYARLVKQVDGREEVSFQFEAADCDPKSDDRLLVSVDADKHISEYRGEIRKGDKTTILVLSDIVIGGDLPAERLRLTLPEGVHVRDVEQFNFMDVLGSAMRLFGAAYEECKELK